jgi:hypothetical protein
MQVEGKLVEVAGVDIIQGNNKCFPVSSNVLYTPANVLVQLPEIPFPRFNRETIIGGPVRGSGGVITSIVDRFIIIQEVAISELYAKLTGRHLALDIYGVTPMSVADAQSAQRQD